MTNYFSHTANQELNVLFKQQHFIALATYFLLDEASNIKCL